MMDVHEMYCGNHFVMHVSQITMLYTYKTGRKQFARPKDVFRIQLRVIRGFLQAKHFQF